MNRENKLKALVHIITALCIFTVIVAGMNCAIDRERSEWGDELAVMMGGLSDKIEAVLN